MGDRANVVVRDDFSEQTDREAVFLYGHWSGYDLPETLREALLVAPDRWTDSAYLARVVFDRMVGESQGGSTGFGISTRPPDNEYDFLVLHKGHVVRLSEAEYADHGFATLDACPKISFEAYVAAPRTWENLTEHP